MSNLTLMEALEENNKKSGLFESHDSGFSYPLGFPIIDQLLGFKQNITKPDGESIIQTRLGVPAGKINMLLGPSSSGKTAAAIQAAWNIVRHYGDDATVIHIDAESATEDQRILDLTGMSLSEYRTRYKLINDQTVMTMGKVLEIFKEIASEKESRRNELMYDTGVLNVYGNPIIAYTPTAIIIDSILKIEDDGMSYDEMDKETQAMRNARKRGEFLKRIVYYCERYNMNVLMINHLGNDIRITPGGGSKQLPFIPTGKNVPGGEKVNFYSSTIILFVPVNSKDTMKHADTEGYNGAPVKISIVKSRSGAGGYTATNEFIQEYGFDSRLTLLNLAKDKGLIGGRNPKSYFTNMPEVTFDTRIFMEEMANNPEIVRTLFKLCKPILADFVREPADENDFIGGTTVRKETFTMLDELYA